jgi:DNA-binding SARP family transcriptional activator
VEFRILGPLEVVEAGRSLPLGGKRQRALLALLLTRANQVVSSDRLIDELWGERPPKAARNTIQFYVSRLRRMLAPHEVIATRPPGYLIQIEPEQLDLHRFESLAGEGRRALAEGRAGEAASTLREALALWRAPALADVASEPFAEAEIARLEELRLATLELRIEADLALGHHAELVGELEAMTAEHPLRERLQAQLMLALYRSGRQAEALDVYQRTRRTLVEELGIEPGPALQELEHAILRQDPSIAEVAAAAPTGSIVVVVRTNGLDQLVAIAEPLAKASRRELILYRLVEQRGELAGATALLDARRAALLERGVAVRAAAFTSTAPSADVVRLSSQRDVDLLLVDAPVGLFEARLAPELETVLADAPCDVAILPERADEGRVPGTDRPVVVPFGGAEHDWAAVELGAWIAREHGAPLKLLGSMRAAGVRREDASRLLATASVLVQRAVGISTEPLLAEPGHEGLLAAADDAGLVVVGLSESWRQGGLGETRLAIAKHARPPALFVRRGLRPGGLAPRDTVTRFTWSLRPNPTAR